MVTNERAVFFILDGYCDLEAKKKPVARVSNSMIGEEILFKQEYDYDIKVRSAYCHFIWVPSKILKIKLSSETLERIKGTYN